MQWSYLVEIGWCGFGTSRDLIPELRLGLIRFAYLGDRSFMSAVREAMTRRGADAPAR